MEAKYRKIGLLVSGIMDHFTEALCRGAINGCRQNDAELIVFPGKYLDRDLSGQPDIMYEYQFNTIFEYAKSQQLDGLIVSAGNIGCFAGDERVREMLQGYSDIPCILVASKWDGYVSVNYDNENGVREGLEYLIDKMHCKKFAMLGGPNGNTDARERKEVFSRTLKEHGIKVTESMFAYGSLNRENPVECNQLLDNNPDVEAIFCVNDDSALGLYDIMKERGLTPGKDIKIFGYDNIQAGSKAQPALSTVGSDAVFLGCQAVQTMCELLDGKQIQSIILPAKFIRRESLGTSEAEEADLSVLKEHADQYFNQLFYRYQNLENQGGSKLRSLFSQFSKCLLQLASDPGQLDTVAPKFLNYADELLSNGALEYSDADDLLQHLERYYNLIVSDKLSVKEQFDIRLLIDQIYRRIIREMDYHAGNFRAERLQDINSMKIFVRDSLKFRRGNDSSYTLLLASLSWLNIRRAYLYTFEIPIPHLYQETFLRPGFVYLKAYTIDGNIVSVPVGRQRIDVTCIFENEHIQNDCCNLVVLPLFYNEMQYGLLLCDLNDQMYENGEFLTNQMGAAVHMIELLKENEKIQSRLEDVVTSLRENNIALDYLSKQDALTGVHNRRGYMIEANKKVKADQQAGKDTIVAYVDMNNLKVVNDRYGHDEGDFSLKAIGLILKELTGNQGVVGRIGGDEYSFVLTVPSGLDEKTLEQQIHDMFAAFNAESEVPYNVTVSVGLYRLSASENIELEDALSYADKKLYIAKQHKVTTVEK